MFLPWTLEEKKLAELIIGNLDTNGYLSITLEELALLSNAPIAAVETILKEFKNWTPSGRSTKFKRMSLLQLTNIKEKDKNFIEKILDRHMNNLGAKKYDVIAKDLQVRREEVIRQ
jgi:RNA polymerase sigma-54 factor